LLKWYNIKKRDPLAFRSITGGLVNSLINPIANPAVATKDALVSTSVAAERDNFKLCDELMDEVSAMRSSFGVTST